MFEGELEGVGVKDLLTEESRERVKKMVECVATGWSGEEEARDDVGWNKTPAHQHSSFEAANNNVSSRVV